MIGLQQNGALTQIGGGITQSVLDRITDLENRLENVTNMLQGKLDKNKVKNSTTITEPGYATDARQLNPAVDGSLAGKVESLKNNDKNRYFLRGGVEIPPGADLNNYKDTGNYCCPYNDVVAQLLNSPTSSAFTLKIEFGSGTDYPIQTLREFDRGYIYFRSFFPGANGTDGKWNEWRVFKNESAQV